ncbi:MAG: dihydroorotase, partial [Bacteroidia bacterium]|nr:dihydroorotase [Bacteroidia bacterium]
SVELGLKGIPDLAESTALQRDLEIIRFLVRRFPNVKIHFAPITTARGVQLIREAKQQGLPITAETSVLHLLLEDKVMRGFDSVYKVNPPLRSPIDRLELCRGVADGTIDGIGSYHFPLSLEDKEVELEYAVPGMASLEIFAPVLFTALQEFCSINRIIDCLTEFPRKRFGLPEITFEVGKPISLTVFDLEKEICLRPELFASKAINYPFQTESFQGCVTGVYQNGIWYPVNWV